MPRQKQNFSQKQAHVEPDAALFAQNMAKAAETCQLALKAFMERQAKELPDRPYDPLNLNAAFGNLFAKMMQNPAQLAEKQMQLWQQYLALMQSATQRMMGEKQAPLVAPDPKDRRFKDAAWQESAVFDFLKQSYLLTAGWMRQMVHDSVSGMDGGTAHKLEFYTRQFVDALSPSNFLMTNPEVLKATLESNGENLVKGFANFLQDIERGHGKLSIRMTDLNAFKIGENIATTPGKVVFENELMQLIQYAPTTKEVYSVPLLLIPAWINKYYILDLQQENSLVKWLVGQGYTVFMVSWVNPDSKLSNRSFEDYMVHGPLAAMDTIEDITGTDKISLIGYCLGGTLLAIVLSWLAAKKQAARVQSAAYLTTLVDFAEAGDLAVFVDEEQLKNLEMRMAESGYLEGVDMAMTFNMLRANDLIWSFVVNQYLLGKDPFPFDLLYWNMDSTRMPAAMHSYYLRNMYQKNLLSKPGGLTLCGEKIDLRKIKTPAYILSTRDDHIAPWKSTYAATQLYDAPVRFVLATSGHVAGVVNPPAKEKYSFEINEPTGKSYPKSPEAWLKNVTETAGSWWPDWHQWQQDFAGEKIPARAIDKKYIIEDAPGRYVKVRD